MALVSCALSRLALFILEKKIFNFLDNKIRISLYADWVSALSFVKIESLYVDLHQKIYLKKEKSFFALLFVYDCCFLFVIVCMSSGETGGTWCGS